MPASPENKYFGPYYYILDKKEGKCSLVTTYSGEGNWYKPYGDHAYALRTDDILYEAESIDYKGTIYRKVELSIDFFETHFLNAAVPGGKPVRSMGACEPYGAWDEYWEKISLFSETSKIRQAIATLSRGDVIQTMFPLFQGMDKDDVDQATAKYEKLREQLGPLVHPTEGDSNLLEALDAATPAQLPKKLGDTTWDYTVETEDDAVRARTVWRWRLLFALAYGLAMKKLPA